MDPERWKQIERLCQSALEIERKKRGETADPRSDLFSFGVVLYEMLAGVHPFKKQTGMDTAGAILKDTPQPLAELRPDIPVLLRHIVKKMLAKDPRDRYPSIHDLRTDLRELMEESNQPARGKRRRLKPLYWIAATALVVVGAGIWAFFQFFPREVGLPHRGLCRLQRPVAERVLPRFHRMETGLRLIGRAKSRTTGTSTSRSWMAPDSID